MIFDVIVVGSGATGSWASKLLTESGLTVLLLEAGPAGPHQETVRTNDAAGARQAVQSQCYAFNADTRHLFVDDIDNPYETLGERPFVWIRLRGVGGRTVLWHGVVLRMSDRQFKAASRDGFGADWPIEYASLQPHYDAVERFLGITGIAAKLDEIPDGLFLPATLSEPAQRVKEAIEIEWPDRHVTALRRAIALPAAARFISPHDAGRPNGAADNRSCGDGPLADAVATGRLTLRTNSVVSRVITERSGRRAAGVEYVDGRRGVAHEAHGTVILLCASTIETTRIMLNSTSRWHPDGIGNSNGLLGQYLTEHICGVGATGVRAGECSGPSDFYIPNFRNRQGKTSKFLRGYGIQGYLQPGAAKTTQCTLICFGEMLPRATNRICLGRTRDRWGIPVASVQFALSDNELDMAQDQAEQAAQMLRQAGFEVTERHPLNRPGCSIHEAGTVRMGSDPATSLLNGFNQSWAVPNLFVTDGAAFPSIGFQNPTLTMMAATGRACDYILREFRRGSW